jgi:hypothetical protein
MYAEYPCFIVTQGKMLSELSAPSAGRNTDPAMIVWETLSDSLPLLYKTLFVFPSSPLSHILYGMEKKE